MRTLLLFLLISGLLFAHTAYAGTLSCTVRSSACDAGEVEIFEMQNTENAHAGLAAAGYTYLVCCSGVTGLGNSCSGTFATALKLSGTTNAQVRQGMLADYASATNACISVPSGGTVSVGYQATNCSGFDTTIGSMIGTTNSHVGNSAWAAGTTKICATAAGAGALSVDIVDADGNPVPAPAILFGETGFSFTSQTADSTFGAADQKVRINNTTSNHQWSLAIAPEGGALALWSAGTSEYDFNDPAGSGTDGSDGDGVGGQMTIDPSAGTLGGTCTSAGISQGSAASFSEVDEIESVTLLTAGLFSNVDCYWDLTGVSVLQTLPAQQTAGSYSLDMTLTIAAI